MTGRVGEYVPLTERDGLTVGSLFSGIGGLDLGLERAGMTVTWQAEIDPYCSLVLAKHWPDVPNFGDVKAINWKDIPRVDLICGGYPCQPFSHAGRRGGAADERHLWPFMLDAVRVLRPRLVLAENVPGHLSLGLDRVLADLAAIGFDAEWSLVSACSVGASHTRERLFVLAHATDDDGEQPGDLPTAVQGRRSGARTAGGDEGRVGWLPEPCVDRVAHGLPKRLVAPALRGVGNSVVPQVAELVGRRVMEMAA